MVCERDPSSPNDPAEGRIALVRDGEWLTADGTTLGADDGVAIAAMMALVEDESLPHGPLELLMTVAEEVGLEGANALDPKLVTGSILVNLDSEEDGRLTVGCAGSTDTWIRIDAPREPPARRGFARPSLARRTGRPLRVGHRPRPLERDQGARSGAARGARLGPFRLVSLSGARAATRSRATLSPSARSRRDSEAGVPGRRSRPQRDDHPRRVREDRRGRRRSTSPPRTAAPIRGLTTARRRSSTRSRWCPPGRSR